MMQFYRRIGNMIRCFVRKTALQIKSSIPVGIYWGRVPGWGQYPCIVIFPYRWTTLCCGLAGLVSFQSGSIKTEETTAAELATLAEAIESGGFKSCKIGKTALEECYLGGEERITRFFERVRSLKTSNTFFNLLRHPEERARLSEITRRMKTVAEQESETLENRLGYLETETVDQVTRHIEILKDAIWCLSMEVEANLCKIADFLKSNPGREGFTRNRVMLFQRINSVLNSIDRLEVRGRDSAGISLLFVLDGKEYGSFIEQIKKDNLSKELVNRRQSDILVNRGIEIHNTPAGNGSKAVAISLTYKIAAEIGSLGDNIHFIRQQIKEDRILHLVSGHTWRYHSISSHTRWASVGAITEANCHPADNICTDQLETENGIIHVCLNGDIDNYRELKKELTETGYNIPGEITSDTKIIPLLIDRYHASGNDIEEAFRLAVNSFHGSHAISMHTNLAPGKLFLAQKGSGQAVFVGIAAEHYMPASEVYGFVEETSRYIKLDGETVYDGDHGKTQGQICILSQESTGGLSGIQTMYYDGTPTTLTTEGIKETDITTRDIDRQGYPHYFLKEISEAPLSVERTLRNRWRVTSSEASLHQIDLDENIVPERLQSAFIENRIRRIFFVGQGTAGVAALACANILNHYLSNPGIQISALKASELSGFKMDSRVASGGMEDVLVVAISQSGTTADTNRTVDMVREQGAYTIAIVNRRDSDITFKVDGVLYTSSGRDIEMSVASTKAFYSQIVAGALLSLFITRLKQYRSPQFISDEVKQLLELPGHMRKILSMADKIEASARRLAGTKTYWAAVGSGPNKASADEIRIKLSELCYKTISSDYVEDKKHIDLSSEPLIIVCAAGSRGSVIGDIIKDTAIFKAHKATPVVIADEGDNRFDLYAADVFQVPVVGEHLAPVLNTLVGHIWGYYAALAINEGSRFLYDFAEEIRRYLDESTEAGLDIYEVILEKTFREKVATFYSRFRQVKNDTMIPLSISLASDLILLLKYLAGKLPVSDFEVDFGKKGTARNIFEMLFERLGESINRMSRPVDAIKHQAKTVTVGTSRISEQIEGILFDALTSNGFSVSQLLNRNVIVMKNIQEIVAELEGSIVYRINNLGLLGEPSEETTIEVVNKQGVLKGLPSRVETDSRLKGTKRIIVSQGKVYIGKGRKDNRSIVVIPVLSTSPTTPNVIDHILLFNVSFKRNIPIDVKIKALGGKYDHIIDIVQENNAPWNKSCLDLVETEELFGKSAEKIAEYIVSQINSNQ